MWRKYLMASCTRKFYKAVAAEYKDAKPDFNDPGHDTWCRMVGITARVLKAENGNFDVDRFMAACGLSVPTR
jgi:hypothetical protein